MADVLLTMLVGWYGFGVLAGIVLLVMQLAGRARRGVGAAPGSGRPDAAEPIQPDAAPAVVAEQGGLRARHPADGRAEDVAERRRAG